MIGRTAHILPSVLVLLAVACQTEPEQSSLGGRFLGTEYVRPTFELEKIHDDVYLATGNPVFLAGCNAVFIINEADVVVVDSNISPQAATILLEALREITDKPVRHVINTHFHFDHVYGNQLYAADAKIIGHEFTRHAIESGMATTGRTYERFIASMPNQIASLRERIDRVSDADELADLEQGLAIQTSAWAAIQTVEHTAPNITFSDHLTLYRGDREIQIIHFGRGHTGGDVVVYLPRERILVTGDLIYETLSYMGDGYFEEWVETLERLKSLDFDWILPGHGAAFQDRDRIDYFTSYLHDFWQRATELHDSGVSVTEAAERIDMRDHSGHYPQILKIGASPPAMERVYELLDQKAGR